MPTIPNIKNAAEWVYPITELSSPSVFVLVYEDGNATPFSVLRDQLFSLDEEYYLVGATSEFDKFSKYPLMLLISKRKDKK